MADAPAFLAGKHCLVLDDEFLIALDIQQTLETAGATVVCLGNADAAYQVLRGGARFDVAVLDVKLTDFEGDTSDVAALLAERDIPFVFLTGMRADNEMARAFPRAPLVAKPYQVDALMDALRKALAGR